MLKSIALEAVIDALDCQSDRMIAYLDRDTGAVVFIDDEIASLSENDEPDAWHDS